MTFTALIPVKGDSSRLPGKNQLPFGDANLLSHKIRQLKKVRQIDQIVVSSESQEMLAIAKSEEAIPMLRPLSYANETLPISEFVSYLGDVLEGDHIIWACVTSPLVDDRLYERAIREYLQKMKEGYDSLVTVCKFQHYLMDEKGPMNFSRGRHHPNSQNLPRLYLFTNGIQITPREKYKEWGDRIGENPYLMEVTKTEAIDIDDIYDYAQALVMMNMPEKLNVAEEAKRLNQLLGGGYNKNLQITLRRQDSKGMPFPLILRRAA